MSRSHPNETPAQYSKASAVSTKKWLTVGHLYIRFTLLHIINRYACIFVFILLVNYYCWADIYLYVVISKHTTGMYVWQVRMHACYELWRINFVKDSCCCIQKRTEYENDGHMNRYIKVMGFVAKKMDRAADSQFEY